MARKSSKVTRVKGNVNVKNGDVVGGNKNVIHNGDDAESTGLSASEKRIAKARNRDIDGLEVTGGDVVFGDKIIKFFQDNLNIYIFKDIKQLAFFLSVVILFSGAGAGGIWYSKQPRRMNGDFNIAVAQFGELQLNGNSKLKPSARAEYISTTIFNFLDSEYKSEGLDVQISHKNIRLITEELQAEELAQRINADMIIYGSVFFQGEKAEFLPRFYISDHPDTQELTGQNELAYPISFTANTIGSDNEINAELRVRSAILVDFTKGLIYFSQKEIDSAINSIQSSIMSAEEFSQPFQGQEVLYLVASAIQIHQKNYQAANSFLDEALNLNPQYARAYLARGNIYYQQAAENDYDAELLNKAYNEFNIALQIPGQPIGAYIPAKAHTALGNVLVVLAQKSGEPDMFTQAIENYSYIVEQYERTHNPILRGNTSIAYFGLGAAYERQEEFEEAIKMYEKAFQLAEDPVFKDRVQTHLEDLKNK